MARSAVDRAATKAREAGLTVVVLELQDASGALHWCIDEVSQLQLERSSV